jgi:hypothetical protein
MRISQIFSSFLNVTRAAAGQGFIVLLLGVAHIVGSFTNRLTVARIEVGIGLRRRWWDAARSAAVTATVSTTTGCGRLIAVFGHLVGDLQVWVSDHWHSV